jgi:hypothetical protein
MYKVDWDGDGAKWFDPDNKSSDHKSSQAAMEYKTNKRKAKQEESRKWPTKRSKLASRGPETKVAWHNEPIVIATDDSYNISLLFWENISQEIADSATTSPLPFGSYWGFSLSIST